MPKKRERTDRNHKRPHLAEALAGLSRKRQEFFRPVLENPREFVLLNVRELAQRLRVDPATVIRVILKMGFASYREFQHYLHELSTSQATSLDSMQTSKTKGSSLTAHIQEAIDLDYQNLQRFRNAIDTGRIATLAKRIHKANRIVVLGGDLAANLAGFLNYHLIVLGLPAVIATSAGESAHLTLASGKNDVIIAISFRRGLRHTVEGLKRAKANGSYCVGVADTLISPIARFSNECFIASVDSPSYGVSYSAPISLLHGILTACGFYDRRTSLDLMKRTAEEQRHGSRWYQEE
jgi:DNA-binding MurR/RpiR family transcriptional regulator